MKILIVSGYAAWNKVSQNLMPSHHLYGIHEMVDYYVEHGDSIRGILKSNLFDGGYVDFYIWKGGKKNILPQIKELVKKSKHYDIVYDQLNRCSIFLGVLKKCGLYKTKLITVMHHPPYDIQLKVADSDAYIFFNNDYLALAKSANYRKQDKYFVNEWAPDIEWYKRAEKDYIPAPTDARFIDTGKSRRDRKILLEVAEESKIRIDYAGELNQNDGFARSYCVDLKDDIGMIHRIMNYDVVLIPVQENKKNKIGPLGITSFLDCIALKKPVIASDNVCFAQEIETHRIGLLYKTGDKESFRNALKNISEDDCLYNELISNIEKYEYRSVSDYSVVLSMIIENVKK